MSELSIVEGDAVQASLEPPKKKTVRKKGAAAAPPDKEGATKLDLPDQDPVRKSRALKLVEMVESQGELFRSINSNSFVTIEGRTYGIYSSVLGDILRNRYRRAYGDILSPQDLKNAQDTLNASTLELPRRDVCTRVGRGSEGKAYLDLGQPGNSDAIEIIPGGGWRRVARPGCCFIRPVSQLPLPTPTPGGSLDDLWDHVNISTPHRPLVLGYMVAALCPWLETQSILAPYGQSGAGKTNSCRSIRNTFDPNDGDLMGPPKDEETMAIDAESGWALGYDNLSGVAPWVSDNLCRLTTGMAWGARTKYTNRDRTLFKLCRPVIANGIDEVAERGDLVSRTIQFELEEIPKRISPRKIRRSFAEVHPGILGCLLDGLAAGLAGLDYADEDVDAQTRDPDFDALVAAAEPAMGLDKGAFKGAYKTMRAQTNGLPLETCVIYQPLVTLLVGRSRRRSASPDELLATWDALDTATANSSGGSSTPHKLWTGTATELLADLTRLLPDPLRPPKGWPTLGNLVSKMVRRISDNLKRAKLAHAEIRGGDERSITFWSV